MPDTLLECVSLERFRARVVDAAKKAKTDLARLHARIKSGTSSTFEYYAPAVIEAGKWIEVLERVIGVKEGTDVGTIQVFAIREILRMAENRHTDTNELRAWAKIVDLTTPGSLHTSK